MRVRKCQPCGESSPYRDWVEKRGFLSGAVPTKIFTAVAKGDPDLMTAPEVKSQDPLLQVILQVLDEGGEKVLTRKQRKAFQLVVREGISYRVAAAQLKVSIRAVQDLVTAGAKKLRILALSK